MMKTLGQALSEARQRYECEAPIWSLKEQDEFVAKAVLAHVIANAEPVAWLVENLIDDIAPTPWMHPFSNDDESNPTWRNIPLFTVPQPLPSAEEIQDAVRTALNKAWRLGQLYCQQADHEFTSQHKKADITQENFDRLVDETVALLKGEK